jgi:hypothetical protein
VTYDRCQFNVVYCNTVDMHQTYDSPKEAIDEYAERLKQIFEPNENPKAPHVQRTWVDLVNTDLKIIHTVDSGIFPCVHSTGQEPPLKVGGLDLE